MLKQFHHIFLGASSSLLLVSAGSLLNASPSQAADRVSLFYGPFQRSVPVSDLRQFAETGTPPVRSELASLFVIVPKKEQQQLLEGLKFKAPLGVVQVDKLVNSPIGDQLLGKIAAVTRRPGGQEAIALRGGLITAAASKDGLGVLSFLEAYPNTLTIDVKKALKEGSDIGGLLKGFMPQMSQ